MLKLEKIARTRDMAISLSDKPPTLNKTFFIALGYALAFHFGAYCLIQISGFKMGYQESILIPAFVAADLQDSVDMRGLQIANETEAFPLPPPPLPAWPHILGAWERPPQPTQPSKTLLQHQLPLASLELPAIAQHDEAVFKDSRPTSPINVTISGTLASCRLLHRDLHEEELTRLVLERQVNNLCEPRRFLFQVQVEDLHGEVFFWECLHSSGEEICHAHALSILKSMHFAIPPQTFTVKGEIEISLQLSQLNWQPSPMDPL